jgi:hypothetical protein
MKQIVLTRRRELTHPPNRSCAELETGGPFRQFHDLIVFCPPVFQLRHLLHPELLSIVK